LLLKAIEIIMLEGIRWRGIKVEELMEDCKIYKD